jgi:hypothetical protein
MRIGCCLKCRCDCRSCITNSRRFHGFEQGAGPIGLSVTKRNRCVDSTLVSALRSVSAWPGVASMASPEDRSLHSDCSTTVFAAWQDVRAVRRPTARAWRPNLLSYGDDLIDRRVRFVHGVRAIEPFLTSLSQVASADSRLVDNLASVPGGSGVPPARAGRARRRAGDVSPENDSSRN